MLDTKRPYQTRRNKMNTKRSIYVLVFTVLLVAAMFFMQSVYASAGISSRGREVLANQADIQRWAAIGEYYSKQPASIDDAAAKLSRDADAARLQALGEAYLGTNLGARQADAARWQALGEAYLGTNPHARQADAARWQAMGEAYSKQSASVSNFDPKQSRDTTSARWQALGEYYLSLNK
jgi:hypothetical protein